MKTNLFDRRKSLMIVTLVFALLLLSYPPSVHISGVASAQSGSGEREVPRPRSTPRPSTRTSTSSGTPRRTTASAKFVPRVPEIEMVKIPAGTFIMDSGTWVKNWEHRVNINHSFYIGKYEITQQQWKAVMGSNPSYFKNCGGDCPVEQVSWNDIKFFIRSLNALQSNYRFRLPSEAEWTYARLGGAKTVWSFGNDGSDLVDYAWFSSNSNQKTHPVGQKKPNDYGLYDMYGNVQEWCEDINSDDYNKLPADGSANTNIGDSRFRVLRGGHYADNSSVVNYYRFWFTPNERVAHSGFRIAASVQ